MENGTLKSLQSRMIIELYKTVKECWKRMAKVSKDCTRNPRFKLENYKTREQTLGYS